MSRVSAFKPYEIRLPEFHLGQRQAYKALASPRLKVLRCGRRWGKTVFAITCIADRLLDGEICAWFAPTHMMALEVFQELKKILAPLMRESTKGEVIRLRNGARIDFWSMENPLAGRSRGYHFVVIDEAAYTKLGDISTAGSGLEMWHNVIRPTLTDFSGQALVCSNAAGMDPDNLLFALCDDASQGFKEFHARTIDNPLLPFRQKGESFEIWHARRARFEKELVEKNDPRVYAQEYSAEFVDWRGEAFFHRAHMLVDGQPAPYPQRCNHVFATIDTAVKTGSDHDGTGVVYFAYDDIPAPRLHILDWDIVQIEGSLLEIWLPNVQARLIELSDMCRARCASPGAFIEDKNSGMILIQQAHRRGLAAHAIKSELTSVGKDGRAISISGYVHRGLVKYTDFAFDKRVNFKGSTRNHLLEQIENFRPGGKDNKRADDLLDAFCYGVAITFGDTNGF